MNDPIGIEWARFLRARLEEDPVAASYVAGCLALIDRYEELVRTGREQGHVEGGDVGEEYRYVVLPILAMPYDGHPDHPAPGWQP